MTDVVLVSGDGFVGIVSGHTAPATAEIHVMRTLVAPSKRRFSRMALDATSGPLLEAVIV